MIFFESLVCLEGDGMAKGKFMLIREIGMGLWNEIHHVLTQLIIAEIMHRVPVIYWGKGSLYAPADGSNAFEQFFSAGIRHRCERYSER